ncbi:hypothetical protein [Cryobacterium sp. Y11]|uniref:hypothetical protein n=1 Tax=Cryobacterium sp. Y11 TaxID=2045016 RepID=UPI0013050373|nr:hypothetical protein [Cryobacterium sp. Y11]
MIQKKEDGRPARFSNEESLLNEPLSSEKLVMTVRRSSATSYQLLARNRITV